MVDPIVAEIMCHDVPSVTRQDTIATVARLMADRQLPGVPVVENGTVVGIVTESDIVARQAEVTVPTVVPFLDAIFLADAGRDFDDELRHVLATTAGDLMTTPVFNIRASASLTQLATLMMEHHVNPVPVVDESLSLVGIVTRGDLVRVVATLELAADANGADSAEQ